jgi:hypothetical protein
MEESDRRRQSNDPPCRSGTARKKRHREKPDQGQGVTRNRENTNDRKEASVETGTQKRDKEPREQLRSKRKFSKTLRETLGLKIGK